jgi:hypothetical protein
MGRDATKLHINQGRQHTTMSSGQTIPTFAQKTETASRRTDRLPKANQPLNQNQVRKNQQEARRRGPTENQRAGGNIDPGSKHRRHLASRDQGLITDNINHDCISEILLATSHLIAPVNDTRRRHISTSRLQGRLWLLNHHHSRVGLTITMAPPIPRTPATTRRALHAAAIHGREPPIALRRTSTTCHIRRRRPSRKGSTRDRHSWRNTPPHIRRRRPSRMGSTRDSHRRRDTLPHRNASRSGTGSRAHAEGRLRAHRRTMAKGLAAEAASPRATESSSVRRRKAVETLADEVRRDGTARRTSRTETAAPGAVGFRPLPAARSRTRGTGRVDRATTPRTIPPDERNPGGNPGTGRRGASNTSRSRRRRSVSATANSARPPTTETAAQDASEEERTTSRKERWTPPESEESGLSAHQRSSLERPHETSRATGEGPTRQKGWPPRPG